MAAGNLSFLQIPCSARAFLVSQQKHQNRCSSHECNVTSALKVEAVLPHPHELPFEEPVQ